MGSSHFPPFLVSLLLLLLLLLLPAGNSDPVAADRAALLLFSSGVGGRTLVWNRSDPIHCSWEGVKCDPATNRVTELRLPGDRLSGPIPFNSIGNLTQLRILSLRGNSLSGSLPSDLGTHNLIQLHLQENSFSGEIPASFSDLGSLTRLDLAGNNLSGAIPAGFNSLTSLFTLRLENNHFSGSIPDLKSLLQLREFNVSFNRLNGSIPSNLHHFGAEAFLGNSLCGSPLVISCPNSENGLSSGAIAGIVIGSVVGLILILVICWVLWKKKKYAIRRKKTHLPGKQMDVEFRSSKPHVIVRESSGSSKGYSGRVTPPPRQAAKEIGRRRRDGGNVGGGNDEDGLIFFGDMYKVFNLDDLLRASAEVLGKGTFGTTYRAYLGGDIQVVVKRLKFVYVSESEFKDKIESLGVLDHENLVPLRAYYYGKDEKLLVYDCMPMGSLASLLHGNRGQYKGSLTWEVRSRIAYGTAIGIKYLHSLGPHFSHGNIRSSNILLNDDYAARLSDYGLSHIVSPGSSTGSNGYLPPEAAMDFIRISQKDDVYSFGVLLLELLTGRNPSDESVDHLPMWVQSVVKEKWTIDVFDSELLKYQNFEDQMVQLLHFAISCASQYPDRRPSMVEVTKRIKEICSPG